MKVKKYNNRTETKNNKGKLHSFRDKPAIVYNSGAEHWYKEGKRHRDNGPAVIWKNGLKKWYKEGQLYISDGSAIKGSNGFKYWYKKDKLHRLDGPAVEDSNGTEGWFYEGREINCKSLEEFQRIINLKVFW